MTIVSKDAVRREFVAAYERAAEIDRGRFDHALGEVAGRFALDAEVVLEVVLVDDEYDPPTLP